MRAVGRPAAARTAVRQVRVRPEALRLALAHRAVAHERAELTVTAGRRTAPRRGRIGRRPAAVAAEASGVAPGTEAPLRTHAALAFGTHQRGARDLLEAVV